MNNTNEIIDILNINSNSKPLKLYFNESPYNRFNNIINIKGFYIDNNELSKFYNEYLNIKFFGICVLTIPFSYLIELNKNKSNSNFIHFSNEFFFIEFNNYLFTELKFELLNRISGFSESFIICNEFQSKPSTIINDCKSYKKLIREIKTYEALVFYDKSSFIFNLDLNTKISKNNYLIQGVIVNINKIYIKNFKVKLIHINNTISIPIDYDKYLIEAYNEEISPTLTYFGFNSFEKYNTKNTEGSIDLSNIKHMQIIIDTVFIDKTEVQLFILNFNYITKYNDNISKLYN